MSDYAPSVELLAPAGDRICLTAAIENGADAVYFGLERGFNARARAENLSLVELPEIMSMLRQRQVRGYVTLNTLVFSDELSEFERVVVAVAEAGADAVLIQDLGVARLVRRLCPELPIHASTQMTITNRPAIESIAELGIERVVLARELSIQEIATISHESPIPVEVFAHGALCVAYSGQCLTSESLGGRSANRGQCAQACRLPYDLYCDGESVDLGQVRYLLSPQDLAAHDYIPQLIDAGVSSLKIEGRLKSPEYVASVTRHYRQAIDRACANTFARMTTAQSEEMELTFSRGLSPGWLPGCDHKRLVPGLSSAKRGICVGHVTNVRRDRVTVFLHRGLQAGDGVMFDAGRPQNEQPGGRVLQIYQRGRRVEGRVDKGSADLVFHARSCQLDQIQRGQDVWKTDDPRVTRRLRKRIDVAAPQRKLDLHVSVVAHVGQPMKVTATLSGGIVVEVVSDQPLEAARKHTVDEPFLRHNLGRLGHTPFQIADLELDVNNSPMVPLSVVGKLRHALVEQLQDQLANSRSIGIAKRTAILELAPPRPIRTTAVDPSARLHVLCRSLAQLRIVLEANVGHVTADFSDIRGYAEAAQCARQAAHAPQLLLATPRIHKPGENGVLHALRRHATHGILARNLAAIQYCREHNLACVADYSLNVANEITAQTVIDMGAERITTSYDLNRDQLAGLVQNTPADWLEVVVHQHMPMFHMEHCVFCAVLSPGTNKTNCGRPCDRHVVHLEDRIGKRHLLTADVGCRNTLYNATPQSAAEMVPDLMRQGVRWFRVELLDQTSPVDVRRILRLYQELLAGDVTGQQVWKQLKALNRVGVTRGTLEASRDPLAIL